MARDLMPSPVVEAAEALLRGDAPFIECARKLSAIRFEIPGHEDDPDFRIFVAIDSETDHMPSQAVRNLCSPKWLAKCDLEAADVERIYSAEARNACDRLISKFRPGD